MDINVETDVTCFSVQLHSVAIDSGHYFSVILVLFIYYFNIYSHFK